jgi:hypothetical protein
MRAEALPAQTTTTRPVGLSGRWPAIIRTGSATATARSKSVLRNSTGRAAGSVSVMPSAYVFSRHGDRRSRGGCDPAGHLAV